MNSDLVYDKKPKGPKISWRTAVWKCLIFIIRAQDGIISEVVELKRLHFLFSELPTHCHEQRRASALHHPSGIIISKQLHFVPSFVFSKLSLTFFLT